MLLATPQLHVWQQVLLHEELLPLRLLRDN